jgi:hypothetical protein
MVVAPGAWPPNEFDHITGKIGHTITVRWPALFLASDGAQGRAGFSNGPGACINVSRAVTNILACAARPGRPAWRGRGEAATICSSLEGTRSA